MYDKAIKELLSKIEILPINLITVYLMKVYGLTENMAKQAIYAAKRNRVGYFKDDYMARTPYIEIDSGMINKAKAFRVALEFLPDSQGFTCAGYPWLISFLYNSRLIQVCRIEKDMELATSMMIAQKPVNAEDREIIVRIAIVDPDWEPKKMKAVGFTNFCTVDEKEGYKLSIIAKVDPENAWGDVDE